MSVKVSRRPGSVSCDDGGPEDRGLATLLGLEPSRPEGPIAAVARTSVVPLELMPSLIGKSTQ